MKMTFNCEMNLDNLQDWYTQYPSSKIPIFGNGLDNIISNCLESLYMWATPQYLLVDENMVITYTSSMSEPLYIDEFYSYLEGESD